MGRYYRVGEFAELTKVSVRTLHHYDQIGILGPASISDGGHRLYTENELLRLQQILTLRYLGFPLAKIGELLDRPDFDVLTSLRIQRSAIRDRITELEQVDAALDRMIANREASGSWDWELAIAASETVQGRREKARLKMESYYTPEQMAEFEKLGKQIGQEAIRSIEERWTALMSEVSENLHLDPASSEARSLADRWNALTEETMSHYDSAPELKGAIQENYEKGSFNDLEGAPNPEMFAFIQKVNEARTP